MAFTNLYSLIISSDLRLSFHFHFQFHRQRHREMAAAGISGVGLTLGVSTSAVRLRSRSRLVTMAVSVDEKTNKSLTLRKSQEAFTAAKVRFPPNSPYFLSSMLPTMQIHSVRFIHPLFYC